MKFTKYKVTLFLHALQIVICEILEFGFAYV